MRTCLDLIWFDTPSPSSNSDVVREFPAQKQKSFGTAMLVTLSAAALLRFAGSGFNAKLLLDAYNGAVLKSVICSFLYLA